MKINKIAMGAALAALAGGLAACSHNENHAAPIPKANSASVPTCLPEAIYAGMNDKGEVDSKKSSTLEMKGNTLIEKDSSGKIVESFKLDGKSAPSLRSDLGKFQAASCTLTGKVGNQVNQIEVSFSDDKGKETYHVIYNLDVTIPGIVRTEKSMTGTDPVVSTTFKRVMSEAQEVQFAEDSRERGSRSAFSQPTTPNSLVSDANASQPQPRGNLAPIAPTEQTAEVPAAPAASTLQAAAPAAPAAQTAEVTAKPLPGPNADQGNN